MKWTSHDDNSVISQDEYLALPEQEKIKYYQSEGPVQVETVQEIEDVPVEEEAEEEAE